MGFIGRWLSDTFRLALALAGAVILMQAPAVTQDYAAALVQVTRDAQRDIEQREQSARRFYGITAEGDASFVAALRPYEPSNAETLALSLDRAAVLRQAWERITAAPLLLQPVVAAIDALKDDHGYKGAVLRTLAETYTPQISFGLSPLAYGLAGLFLGSLLCHLSAAGTLRMRGFLRRRAHREALRT
jgi:hypothetical protein